MKASPAALANIADQFLVAYACASSVQASSAALFNVGHAAELYLKAVKLVLDPQCDASTYKHDIKALLRDIQTAEPTLLSCYSLRQRAIDLYLANLSLSSSARNDPDYDHFNEHRELYWVSTYLMDTKYLFASHGKKLSGKDFAVMILGLNEYWQPFSGNFETISVPTEFVFLVVFRRQSLIRPYKPAPRHTSRRSHKMRANPSIERTSTGLARYVSLLHVPLRGPSRFRPAHVKR